MGFALIFRDHGLPPGQSTAGAGGYEDLYQEYLALARHFGEGGTEVMKRLRARRRQPPGVSTGA